MIKRQIVTKRICFYVRRPGSVSGQRTSVTVLRTVKMVQMNNKIAMVGTGFVFIVVLLTCKYRRLALLAQVM